MRRILQLAFATVVLAAVAVACGGDDDDTPASTPAASGNPTVATGQAAKQDPNAFANPQMLLDGKDLAAKLGDASVAIVDLRKRESYDAGHIPGAVWYDSAKLKDAADKLHVIAEAEFAKEIGGIGIDNSKRIIAYDDNTGLSAARFWWVLDYYGHTNAGILNGGWDKWKAEGLPETKDPPKVTAATFKTSINDKVICATDYVQSKAEQKDAKVVILDVRTAGEYNGADVRAPAAKGGHVPNAVNLDWARSLTDAKPQVWKSPAELRKQFEAAGVTADKEVITYCQTAVRASHSLFTLRLLGYGQVRNYDGSWAEWGSRKDTPVQK